MLKASLYFAIIVTLRGGGAKLNILCFLSCWRQLIKDYDLSEFGTQCLGHVTQQEAIGTKLRSC